MDTTMPRSSSKLTPPSVTAVDEESCCQSQLIAESAVFPKADATLPNTDVVTLLPMRPINFTPSQTGSSELHTQFTVQLLTATAP